MRLILEGDRRIRLQLGGEGLKVESVDSAVRLSPLHMLAGSLATCTAAVLMGWARQSGVEHDGLEIILAWDYIHNPYRVGTYAMELVWPDLPDEHREDALRVAQHCTVENTLRLPTRVETRFPDKV